jgi:dipeptidyl aminopeptidase/acylaminoacyl peptidase
MMGASFRILAVIPLALALCGAALAAPAALPAEPPGLSSGVLANRQFLVRAPRGSGIALYYGNGSLEGSKDDTRAVVVVHGVLRDADAYFATGQAVLQKAGQRHTLLVAPQFVEAEDLSGHRVPKNTLRWDDNWPGGSDAVAPAPVSTYDVFDAILQRLADRRRFPAVREVIVVGHSAGGQIVQRYAVVGRGPSIVASRVNVHLVVANPSSYLYFDGYRPYPQSNCPGFNTWRYGLKGAPPYVSGSATALEKRYVARHVTYLLGTADTDAHEWDLDRTCAAEAQGAFRFERGKAYVAYIARRHPAGTAQDYAYVQGVPHDNRRMFTSDCGIAVLFGGSTSTCAASGKVGGRRATALKPALDYSAYDGWNAFAGVQLSQDGTWLAYGVTPEDGDGTLVVRNLSNGTQLQTARGKDPRFTEDGRFVLYTIAPLAADLDAARRAHKKPDEQPKSGLGILALPAGTATSVERVKSYAVAKHGSHFVAYLLEAQPAPKASPAASPSPTPSPVPENKKKSEGTTLVLRDLSSGSTVEVAGVTEYRISDDERYLAYARQSVAGTTDGVFVRDLQTGAVVPAAIGSARYARLAFAPSGDVLAFESDRASYASASPRYDLYMWHPNDAQARVVLSSGTKGLPDGWAPDPDGDVRFSKDGTLLFVGANAAPTPQPSSTPEPMQVDLWNWRDERLQSEQKVEADQDRKRAYLGVLHVGDGSYVQIADAAMASVQTNDNDAFALGSDPRPYEKQRSWDDFYEDDYAVNLQTGARRLIGQRQREQCQLSPAGKYVLCYDRNKRAWYTVRTSDGRKAYLTANLRVPFYDEIDDHPALPPPYGSDGWTRGDGRVLLLDRYDVWSIDPDGGKAFRLTNGYGRAHALRFQLENVDPEATSIDPDGPLYLSALNDSTKASGFFDLPNARIAANPRRLVYGDYRFAALQKAQKAERFVYSRQRFDEYPDRWTAGAGLSGAVKVTRINPQMARYRWGSEHLIHYTTLAGKHLDGILYLPDGFDPNKKYPMLVYFYERFADDLHAYYAPRPTTGPVFARYVSHGYVVLIPDIAYATGHPGKSAYDAVMPAIDSVVRRGFVDTRRIGVSGHSWGAYQIAYLLTKTHRFAAAEAGAAVADMTSAYGGIRWGSGLVRSFQYEHGQSRIGSTPWQRPDLYLENSALFSVPRVTTPYLTIANDNDDAVPWYQGIEFFTALRRLNKEAYMFVFNGEYHNLRGREQQKYWTVHFDEFFDHFLLGTPAPQWMTQGVDYLHRGERNVRPLFGEKP